MEQYVGYSTLQELKEYIDRLIEKYGADQKYAFSGCYGSEGDVVGEEYYEKPVLFIATNICSG